MAETVKLLNKNLNFVPTQTNFSKSTLNEEFEDFYRILNSKAILKMPRTRTSLVKKTWVSDKNHHRNIHGSNTQ